MAELELVDPQDNPHLRGRFAPVDREIEAAGLTVEGDLPVELAGAYLRNGPNPKFPPLGSYTYPMEGDGMLHGLWFEDGSVRYRNRWVETAGLRAEEAAGKALFGGVMTPAFVDLSALGPDPDPGWPSKLDAFINVVRHHGRYLALEEGTPAYEVTAELETVGRYDFGGGLAKGMTAHPKIDPVTGELVTFRYDVEAPFVSWAVIAADGSVAVPETALDDVDQGVMVHDCAITEQHLVLVLAPAVFDLDSFLSGGPLLAWQPDLGTRIAVIRRDGAGPVRWIHTDAFWVWHFANAHDRPDGTIAMDFPRWQTLGFLDPGVENTCDYVRAVLSPDAGTLTTDVLHSAICDFPRIDERRLGREQRYSLMTAVSDDHPPLVSGEHDALCRVDLQTGDWAQHPTGGALGETIFVPRPGGTDELDGWYLGYVNSEPPGHTALGIWEAADFPREPRATVLLPHRVPNGLHGNWFPA